MQTGKPSAMREAQKLVRARHSRCLQTTGQVRTQDELSFCDIPNPFDLLLRSFLAPSNILSVASAPVAIPRRGLSYRAPTAQMGQPLRRGRTGRLTIRRHGRSRIRSVESGGPFLVAEFPLRPLPYPGAPGASASCSARRWKRTQSIIKATATQMGANRRALHRLLFKIHEALVHAVSASPDSDDRLLVSLVLTQDLAAPDRRRGCFL